MTADRKGIVIAGSIITDLVKAVDCYHEIGMLANINIVTRPVECCHYYLTGIGNRISVSAIGSVVGNEYRRLIISQFGQHGLRTDKCVFQVLIRAE